VCLGDEREEEKDLRRPGGRNVHQMNCSGSSKDLLTFSGGTFRSVIRLKAK